MEHHPHTTRQARRRERFAAWRHRRWHAWVLFVHRPTLWAVIAVVVAVALIHDRALTLEYLKVLAWPLVVGAAAYWLREPIRAKFADILKAKGPGVEIEFIQRAVDSGDLLEQAVEVLPATLKAETPDGTRQDGVAHPGLGDGEDGAAASLNTVIQQAIEYGFNQARAGTLRPPRAELDWPEGGAPTLRLIRAPGRQSLGEEKYESIMRMAGHMETAINEGWTGEAVNAARDIRQMVRNAKAHKMLPSNLSKVMRIQVADHEAQQFLEGVGRLEPSPQEWVAVLNRDPDSD